MRIIQAVLLIGGAVLVTAYDQDDVTKGLTNSIDYTVNLCISAGDIDGHNNPKNGLAPTRRHTYIFNDHVVPCDGRVGHWEFFSNGIGTFYASLWRPNRGTKYVQFVGANKITVETPYEIEFVEVPLHNRLWAEAGDIIGFFFDPEDGNDEDTVVAVEREDLPGSYSLPLSDVITLEDISRQDIQSGSIFPMVKTGLRMAASLKAEIVGTTTVSRFARDDMPPLPGQGRAEIFKGGIWGTVCDTWFHQRGWPYLFCKEMGFPDPIFSYYTSSPQRHQADPSRKIHMKNPRCKPSQNITMISCDLHESNKCEGHALDLYIICRAKVELRYGAIPESEGVVFVYETGYWGTICDDADPENIPKTLVGTKLKKDLRKHWCNVVCNELGFSSCDDVYYARDTTLIHEAALEHLQMYAIARQSPKCEDDATNIDQCPPARHCSHIQDYYIICATDHLY